MSTSLNEVIIIYFLRRKRSNDAYKLFVIIKALTFALVGLADAETLHLFRRHPAV
jgi:hypothetical protein